MKGRIEDRELRDGVAEDLAAGPDPREVCRVVERGELAKILDGIFHVLGNTRSAAKLEAAMHDTMAHEIDFLGPLQHCEAALPGSFGQSLNFFR